MKNISVVGVGKLGLCFCLSLERKGFNVVGVDQRDEHVQQINEKSLHSQEVGVTEALKKSKNFLATTDLSAAVRHSDVLFVLVATPSLPDGSYDHSQIHAVIDGIKKLGRQNHVKHLVVSCTTMPGFCDEAAKELAPLNWTLSYNPEFIAQGTVLRDMARPDFVLIGENNTEAGQMLKAIYSSLCENAPPIHRMGLLSAEITKLSLNCFLTAKIAFANMIGDLAMEAGANPEAILRAIGSDSRVGGQYFSHGFGFGGPCLPRDNRALRVFARRLGMDSGISQAVDAANEEHLKYQIQAFRKKNGLERPVRLGPVTYKPGTGSIENSQQLKFALGLAECGYKVVVEDQESVIQELKERFPNVFHDYTQAPLP